MTITTAQQTALEKVVVPVAHFAEFQFLSGTVRVTTWNNTLNWGGYDWLGFGNLINISSVTETGSMETSGMTFSLTAANTAWLSFAVGSDTEYRKRPASLYMGPLDENHNIIGTPFKIWTGVMDSLALGIDGENASLSLKCETLAYALKRKPTRRMNAVQHKQKYPTDTGFDYLSDLIKNPAVWLSVLFQKQ